MQQLVLPISITLVVSAIWSKPSAEVIVMFDTPSEVSEAATLLFLRFAVTIKIANQFVRHSTQLMIFTMRTLLRMIER